MRRASSVLVILVASLLANVLLAVRLARREDPAPVPKSASVDRALKADEAVSLRRELEGERKKNEELRARVDQLEAAARKGAPAEAAAPAPKVDKLALFREKLRKLMKLSKDPAAKAGGVDAEMTVELTEAVMELMKISALRAKDPKTYSDYMRACYELALEGDGTGLSEAQSAAVADLLQGLGEDLAKVPAAPAGDHLVKEIELEAQAMKKVFDLLSDGQKALLAKDNMNAMASGNMLSTSYVMKDGAVDQIANSWKQLYQLDDAQLPSAKAAAQSFVEAMARLDEARKQNGAGNAFTQMGTPQWYDYRLRSVQEQLTALNLLQASMTPEQRDRLRSQTMREFVLFDPASVTATQDK